MPKITQNYRLYTALKSGNAVSLEDLQKELNISLTSIPVYIHDLKVMFKADIESIRDGKKVVAYRLLNADKIKVPEYRINNAQAPKKAEPFKALVMKPHGGYPTVAHRVEAEDTVLDQEEERELDTRELDDLKDSLGLSAAGYDSEFSNRSGGNDW